MNVGKVHCMFEQSGTFKKQFKELGINACDYDIENEFGETDVQMDLFAEIERAYEGERSVFDGIAPEDLVMAFFPCIRFEDQVLLWFRGENNAQRKWDLSQKIEYDLQIHAELNRFYSLVMKLVSVAIRGGVEADNRKPVFDATLSAAVQSAKAVPDRRGQAHKRRLLQEADNVLFRQLRAVAQFYLGRVHRSRPIYERHDL